MDRPSVLLLWITPFETRIEQQVPNLLELHEKRERAQHEQARLPVLSGSP